MTNMTNAPASCDLTETARIANVPMAALVFGPRPRRVRFPGRFVFVAAVLAATMGCATAPRPAPAVEAVGQLAPSYHSLAVAAVHHDAPPEFGGVVDTGDDSVGEGITTVSHAPGAGGDGAELPDVAPKDDGIKLGGER